VRLKKEMPRYARQDKKRKLGRIRWRRDAVPNEVRDASLSLGKTWGRGCLAIVQKDKAGQRSKLI
jgi:hypothetical protein